MKNTTKIFIFLMLASLIWLASFAAAPQTESRTIIPSVLIYESPSLTAATLPVILPQNAVVETVGNHVPDEILGANYMWQKITYTGFAGYIPASSIYETKISAPASFGSITAKSSKMGEKIAMYSSHTTESEIIAEIDDGTKLEMISNGLDYGEFSAVLYNGTTGFVKTSNLTSGLSQNQIIAVIVICVAVFIVAAYIILIRIISNRKKSADA